MQKYEHMKTSISVNYWKEIGEEITDLLKNLSGIVLVMHNSVEFTGIVDFLNMIKTKCF